MSVKIYIESIIDSLYYRQKVKAHKTNPIIKLIKKHTNREKRMPKQHIQTHICLDSFGLSLNIYDYHSLYHSFT